ncbi:indole-3-glycerol phosphate synthase-domain-containing protein [Syncephalis plumigaleata]|nr:indole-3-glycerol phosphate synthase-domain-containing protein [Syncephalis plumigaleata]
MTYNCISDEITFLHLSMNDVTADHNFTALFSFSFLLLLSVTIGYAFCIALRLAVHFFNMVLVLIDNYDSFTWNIYQYLCSLGADVRVFRNDKTTVDEVASLNPTHVVISPGPGHPSTDAGISKTVIAHFAGKIPVLGVCLGHQCIYEMYGGVVNATGEIVHGKTSALVHDGKGLFLGVPQGVEVTRYHSLAGDPSTLPADLMVTARTADGVIEGVRHRSLCIVGVQFHPESILSGYGMEMLASFLRMHAGTWAEQQEFNVACSTDDPAVTINGTTNGATTAVTITTTTTTAGTGAPTILERIQAQRKLDVAAAKAQPGQSEEQLRALVEANANEPAIDLYRRLQASAAPGQPAVMAEIKRASPSKGIIDISINAGLQARKYAEAGAAVISVLTEPTWFRGNLEDLRQARSAVSHLPYRPAILRKDFIVDAYQIYEARLAGADTVLLIVAILTDVELAELMQVSRSIGMEPLVEVNNQEEMQRALKAGARVIGVNNRNLHTFDVDPTTTTQLAHQVPSDVILAALSGIMKRADVEPYLVAGASAILVGEALMRSSDPAACIRELRAVTSPNVDIDAIDTSTHNGGRTPPHVKICGIRTVEAALAASEAGARFLGMIFAPTRRRVTIGQARAIAESVRAAYAPNSRVVNNGTNGTTTMKHIDVNVDDDDDVTGGTPRLNGSIADAASLNWFEHQAKQIAKSSRPLLVGVFQNQSLEYMTHVAREVGLDYIQLHGQEPTEISAFLPVPTIRAFHLKSDNSSNDNEINRIKCEIIREGYHALPLLDAYVANAPHQGGQGVAINAKTVTQVTTSIAGGNQKALPVILAGGLNPQNVAQITRQMTPWAVDVSSGVETDGVQDVTKIRAFIHAVQHSQSGLA